MYIENFKKQLKEHGIELSDDQIKQFEDYRILLQEYNEKINLTAIIESEEIYIKHFFDSLIPSFHYKISGSLLD
ncbi:MAG TPA: RsmG family class I SAM-dependent methyltransferase, partial [Erysipelotrichaceae bacterium]|nr:RsmG family class I SAM-dependent methyltransferase [Erysipelotrichaceae bacterium]